MRLRKRVCGKRIPSSFSEKGMIFMDYFIEFLIMMVASVFGILIGAGLVDLFQKLRMKWRRHK